jgi:hypothetical protein
MSSDQRPGGGPDRQAPDAVRAAARACLSERASTFTLALAAMVVRRSGATAADWALIVRALFDPDPADRVPDARALADRCFARACADAPEDPELARLHADLSLSGGSSRGEPPATETLVAQLLDVVESASAAPAEVFLAVPPDEQDVVVTELGDEAEPRTATLVAAILRAKATPALHEFLLEHIEAWAAHPEVRHAVEELAESGRAPLIEASLDRASLVIDGARDASLRLRPSAGRSARHRAEEPRKAQGVVFSGTAYRRGSILPLCIVAALAITAGITAVVLGLEDGELGRPLAAAAVGAAVLGLVTVLWARVVRVPYRIVVAKGSTFFEIADGPRPTRIPFPLDYQAALDRASTTANDEEIVTLHLSLRDREGRSVAAFVEPLAPTETPPRGWVEASIDSHEGSTHGRAFGRIHLDRLEQEIARWNREP